MSAQMDLITANGALGEIATKLAAEGRLDIGRMRPFVEQDGQTYVSVYVGGDPKKEDSYRVIQLNQAGTLRRDEWKQLDEAVLKVAESRLGGFQDVIDAGLVYNLGNAMGTTVLEYHDISDTDLEADITMDGITRAQGARPQFTTNYLPIPIVHADYEINARVLAASRNMGNPLDTTMAERAARKVQEKLELMLFGDKTYSYGGGTIHTYMTFPHANTNFEVEAILGADASTILEPWNELSDEKAIVKQIIAMKQASLNDKFFGPWNLYIPPAYETILDEDYKVSGGKVITIRDRLMAISGIRNIKVIDFMPEDTLLLVQMTSDVVRIVRGMGLQNVEWSTEGNMVTKYKVMTIQVPQIRADQEGKCGIVRVELAA